MSELTLLEADEARRLTERIRLIAQNVADNVEKLRELVQKAKDSDVHVVLGYASWTAYLKDVFGDEPLRLARDVRQELVAELAAQGMSTRAIAPIVGADQATVVRDLSRGDASASPERTVFAAAPETNPAVRDSYPQVDSTTGEVTEHDEERAPVEVPVAVTGLDGKNYARSAAAPRRASIIDDAHAAGWQLRKAIERIQRVVADDRFSRNWEDISAALEPHINFALEVFPTIPSTEKDPK